MTSSSTEVTPPAVGGAPSGAVTARECANRAAAALALAEYLAYRGNQECADALTRTAGGWHALAVDIARNVDMAPLPADTNQ